MIYPNRVFLITIAVLLAPIFAKADCLPVVHSAGGLYENVSGGYDAFVPGIGVRAIDITVTNPGSSQCRITLTQYGSSNGDFSLNGSGDSVDAKLFFDSGLQHPVTDRPATSASTWTLEIDPGEEVESELFVTVPAGQFVSPGTYDQRLVLNVIDADDLERFGQTPLLVQTVVLSRAQLSFDAAAFSGASGQQRTLDFGELSSGETRELVFFVRANGAYKLEMESENGGALKNQFSPNRTKHWRVPYTISLNGRNVNHEASDKRQQMSVFQTRGAGDKANRLSFEIGDVTNKAAGSYSDTVYIRVDSLN